VHTARLRKHNADVPRRRVRREEMSMLKSARGALLTAIVIVVSACSGPATTNAPASAAAPTASPSAAGSATSAAPIAGGLLEKVLKAGKITVSTDPKYPPQSEQNPDGSYQGFDIDVAAEIAKRLGVRVDFTTPDWTAITAGSWAGRWDMSVGSMTITPDRKKVLDFSPPYYYTPAQMAASKASGITTLDGLAGKTVCSGESTTYDQWLKGTLDFGTGQTLASPPAGIKATTLPTDTDCPDQWKAGRNDFQGWLSSATTVDGAIAAGLPLVKVGDPVFFEPLAVAVDRSGPPDSDFVARLTDIVNAMHQDGTLTQFSTKWFKRDLTKAPGA
jgi:polar amino acid transport system substrate-binding protein